MGANQNLFILPLLLVAAFFVGPSHSQLSTTYYQTKCPNFDRIMLDTTTNKQIASPTTAAATLRVFLHDCLPNGCDASVLVSSTPFNNAERDADINLSLPGDAFDLVVRAKAALELSCPGVVSCADILAIATRNLVVMAGGPYYSVRLGRLDGLVSRASAVEGNLPRPTMTMAQITGIFRSRGFSVQEMVALSGAHTIGFSHCSEFSSALYNYSKTSPSDPTYNPRFAAALRNACANYRQNPTLAVFNDVMTPNKFDNAYFQNLPEGLGVLASDRNMYLDAAARPYADLYAKDQAAFFKAFSAVMVKLSELDVKIGRDGEIRRRCDAFNH